MDDFLLAAMREVDEMFPDTPPIAPRKMTPDELAYFEGQANAANDPEYNVRQALGAMNARFLEVECDPRDLRGIQANFRSR